MYVDPAEQQAFRRALEQGIALFNRQLFVEAYEVWAERWEEETTEGADLLQGLLKMAVGCAKLESDSPRGALKLFDGALEKLTLYAPRAYDLDVEVLMGLVRGWRETARERLDTTES